MGRMGAEEAGEQGSRGAGGNEELEKYLECGST